METLVSMTLGLVILLGVISYAKAKFPKTKRSKFPAWAKLDWRRKWGNPFLDRNRWIKGVLAAGLRIIIWILLYLKLAISLLLSLSWQFAKKATLPK